MAETAIAEHGIIGDLQSAALVTTDGSIDWFCVPRFDSPSVFGALLDDASGGHFRIRPGRTNYRSKQVYYPDTAVLVTRFFTDAGLGQVVDFMPPAGDVATDNRRIVRVLQCVRGEVTFQIDIAPRFDYGRQQHKSDIANNKVVFTANGRRLVVHGVRDADDEPIAWAAADDQDVTASVRLGAGQRAAVVLESAVSGRPREIRVAEVQELFDQTVAVLAGVAVGSHLQRPVARGRPALGDHAEADDLLSLRGFGGGADRGAA